MATLIREDGTEMEVSPPNGRAFTLADIRRAIDADTALYYDLTGGYYLFYNDDGKLEGLPINERATDLAFVKHKLRRYDFMVGPCLLVAAREVRL